MKKNPKDDFSCKKCGASILSGQSFCSNCGSRINEEEHNKCPKCGRHIINDMPFCAFCGTELSTMNEVNSEDEKVQFEKEYSRLIEEMDKAESESDYEVLADGFKKICGYKDSEDLKNECIDNIEKIKEAKKEKDYFEAIKAFESANSLDELYDVANRFSSLGNYLEAQELYNECINKIEVEKELEQKYYDLVNDMDKAESEADYKATADRFGLLGDYKNSKTLQEECLKQIEDIRAQKKEQLYNNLLIDIENADTKSEYKSILDRLLELGEYKDSDRLQSECVEAIKEIDYSGLIKEYEIAKEENEYTSIAERFAALNNYKESERYKEYCYSAANKIRYDCDVKALTLEVDALEARKSELENSIRKNDDDAQDSENDVKEQSQMVSISKKKLRIIITVLIVAAVILVAYIMMSNSNTKKDVQSESDQATEENISGSSSENAAESGSSENNASPSGDEIVLRDTDKYTMSITDYNDKTGEFAVKIVNNTNREISCYSEEELLDGMSKCVADTDGSESFAYADVPGNESLTVFSFFHPTEEENEDKPYKLSDEHTFDFKMTVMDNSDEDEDFWDDTFKVKITPDMFGY